MQVDEEFKGSKPEWQEASDSEDERDKKDLEELDQKSAKFEFNEKGATMLGEIKTAGHKVTIILCTGITS